MSLELTTLGIFGVYLLVGLLVYPHLMLHHRIAHDLELLFFQEEKETNENAMLVAVLFGWPLLTGLAWYAVVIPGNNGTDITVKQLDDEDGTVVTHIDEEEDL